MNVKIDYRNEGYQQGYKDSKRTYGKISPKYKDSLFKSTKNSLSPEESSEYITGWHDGFADGLAKIFRRIVHEEGLAKKYLSDLNK